MINILFEDIFSNNKCFSSYKKLEGAYKINVEKNQFETPKNSVKNSDKTQDIEVIITQNRYEVPSDSDESYTNGYNNDNDKLSNNVTASILSQVNLRNDGIKEDQHKYKSKT